MNRKAPRLVLAAVTLVFASRLPTLSNSALAETATWSVSKLQGRVNTKDHEAFPAISKDGLVMYFSRAESTDDDWWDIWDWNIYVSTRPELNSAWGEPRALPSHINTEGTEHSVSFSPDGHWLYFSSDNLGGCGGLDIFKSYREDLTDDLAWGIPVNLGCKANSPGDDVCVIYHEEDSGPNLYFVSNRGNTSGDMNVWRLPFDPETDTYGNAEALLGVSSAEFDGHLDPTAGYVWTEREGGHGSSDIWQSKRDADGNWLAPTNLGESINTEFEEQLPAPFDEGRVIYFPSDRPGTVGGLDILVAERAN
jgi:hypothetical protein